MMQEEIYIVQKGDTLEKIAQKKNITKEKLMEINQLENTLLQVGQKLLVKEKEIHIGSDICGTFPKIETPMKYDTYTVKKKDNLYTLAKKFNTTVASLKYINHLDNPLLSIGQVLKVPFKEETMLSYTVQKGDTLYTIASNYHLTPHQIITINHLPSTSLQIGQVLKLPISSSFQKEK